ncbi:hypothetical protein GCM10011579_041570 [Streptomyces albiflavescens]|uniref:Uncharacterized protein n=1 Tax=Streptomyces albiflavescens TaxID=1623582 RepID=A0A917Y6G1_9ACTN|nr:hypothetical protein GCM10011579_041570 [Streptomyces albiflavescens]
MPVPVRVRVPVRVPVIGKGGEGGAQKQARRPEPWDVPGKRWSGVTSRPN